MENKPKSKSWFIQHKVVTLILLLVIVLFGFYIVARGNDANEITDQIEERSNAAANRQQEAHDAFIGK